MEIESRFSISARRMSRSIIRELLKLTRKPGLISFAGGLPFPGTFPKDEIKDICDEILSDIPDIVLQYSATEGIASLRESLTEFLKTKGFDIGEKQLIVTTASQQSLDLVGKIFIDRGDTIVTENPSYLGALSAFRAYGAKILTVDIDGEGMRTDLLGERLKEIRKGAGNGSEYYQNMPKFIYTIPDFQNPTGTVMSLKRRKELLELSEKYDLLIIEDIPYRWLRYRGESLPMLSSMDVSGRVIGLFTFSKILSPGLRLGWITARKTIVDKIVQAKQASDLCTSALTQGIADLYIRNGFINSGIESNIITYREKLDVMLEAIDEFFPKVSGMQIYKPAGGLFLWIKLPENIDTDEMFKDAIDRNVAYVIGSAFYPNGGGHSTMRLNFSYSKADDIHEGIKRLGGLIGDTLKERG